MTAMTAKEYLNQYKFEQQKIDDLLELYKIYETRSQKVTSLIDGMPKGQNKEIQDNMAEIVAKMADISNEYISQLNKAENIRIELQEKIKELPQPFQNILFFRYIAMKDFDYIADKMILDRKYIINKHGDALVMFENLKNKVE